jgi:PAS domain S-box-containing protein
MARRMAWRVAWFAAIVVASLIPDADHSYLQMAIAWLPSGLAVMGLWRLGYREAWIVALAVASSRLAIQSPTAVVVSSAVGSTMEGLLGAWLLRRLRVAPTFAQMRDVVGLLVVSALAPIGSILASWLARGLFMSVSAMPFYSGWGGWWRMNALGMLLVIPLNRALCALRQRTWTRRVIVEAVIVVTVHVVVVSSCLAIDSPGPLSVSLVYLALPVVLLAALRLGIGGASILGTSAALAFIGGSMLGRGPFLAVPFEERHFALQVFALSLVAVPLLVAALIDERRHSQEILAWEARILGIIARGGSSLEFLRATLEGLERINSGGSASVLLRDGNVLRPLLGPSLPPAFSAAFDGLPIAPGMGCCGTAAFKKRTVIVSDIATDPLWRDFAAHALTHGYHACWSVPIMSSPGEVLGTIATYYRAVRAPTPAELALVERAGALAGIVLERESREDLLSSITRTVGVGIYRTSAERGFLYANQALVRMFGYESIEEFLRIPAEQHYVHRARRAELIQAALKHGVITNEEVLFQRRDGSTFWGRVTSKTVQRSDGVVFDGTIADITAHKRLEEELRQAQKMEAVGRLAGGVAHDFNNLLTVIGGRAEALLEDLPPSDAARGDATEILSAVERGADVTRQLLTFGRQQAFAPQVLELRSVLDQLVTLLRRLIREDITLDIEHAAEDLHVRADRGQIEQVVLNLVINARDALPRGGKISLTTAAITLDDGFVRHHEGAHAGEHALLTVSDTGQGMDELTRSRAFDPFFTTKEPGRGTGLGLSTVYGIVRQNEGFVLLDSEPGKGTRVSVYWPIAPAGVPRAAARKTASARRAQAATILVVEDEDAVRQILVTTLRAANYSVLEAESAEHALEVAREADRPIDLLVSDVMMQRMDGLELAEELKRERPDLRVLFVSGYSNEGLEDRAILKPVSRYLQKPFTRSELLARTQELLEVSG